jgi:AcrR family transcriptional regulator
MDRATRQHILDVARRHFAEKGYAATSVQDIVDEARVAKPMLYYYFQSKAGLYHGIIDNAHEERFRIVQQAADSEEALHLKLRAILLALFAFIQNNRDVVRLAFASAFAAPGELPPELQFKEKCQRSFEFFQDLIRTGLNNGELDDTFGSRELTMAWYGVMNMYVMGQLFQPEISYDAKTAETIVEIFFRGADAKRRKKGPVRSLAISVD